MTGASRGFGRACVEVFSAAGWEAIGASRAALDRPVSQWVRWDVTNDDVSPLQEVLRDRPLDLLINNAGAGTPGTPLDGVSIKTLLDVCDVNVGGVLRATRAVLPNLLRAEAPLVINVSSRLGSIHDQAAGRYRDFDTSYAYRISKAAQNMATACLATELGPRIRVWSIHPGSLATGMGRTDATGDPVQAARNLLELATSDESRSPRFLDLTDGEINW